MKLLLGQEIPQCPQKAWGTNRQCEGAVGSVQEQEGLPCLFAFCAQVGDGGVLCPILGLGNPKVSHCLVPRSLPWRASYKSNLAAEPAAENVAGAFSFSAVPWAVPTLCHCPQQVGKSGHCSVEDARTTMELYKVVEAEWEQHLMKEQHSKQE